ncbi:MAG TPA: IS110 family transposase [Anaerolineales bacterium]|nr:IS110 family transposase [Anaerolineales bacterium]
MMSRLSQPNTSLAEARPFQGMSVVNQHAAGVDLGAHEIMVCIPGPDNTQLVRSFGNYTADLHAIARWLGEHSIWTVAMESTGVYWIPLFEILEIHKFQCLLISSRSLRCVPGRKSDVVDCQWIQTLHTYGLLTGSFRPEADLVALRTLLRHRARLLEHRAPHILHMQKALLQMNIQLSQVLTDVTGDTGLRIIRAMVAGERDPYTLAAMRNYRCKKDEREIAKALTGTWRQEHLFVLEQSLALYDFYTEKISACDTQIEQNYKAIRPDWRRQEDIEHPVQPKHLAKNAPKGADQLRTHLKRICGVDLVAVYGISVPLAQTILTEIGTDMSKFPNEKHFCSWLGLAPKNEISGGKVLVSRTLKTRNRAGQAFRLAAISVMRADCVFGAFYRRMKSRLGPAQATVATAHLMARVVYRMLKYRVEYEPLSISEYEKRYHDQQIKYLEKRVAKFGFQLTPVST